MLLYRGYCLNQRCIQIYRLQTKFYIYTIEALSTLKKEELHREDYKTTKKFLSAIEQYIKYYNNKRIHSKLDYTTPNETEHLEYERIA